jgi:hypothetical protein
MKSIGKKVLIHILLIILGKSLRPSTTCNPLFKTGQRRLITHTKHITDEPYQISIPFRQSNLARYSRLKLRLTGVDEITIGLLDGLDGLFPLDASLLHDELDVLLVRLDVRARRLVVLLVVR